MMSNPSRNIVLALESFHCSWAKRKEQGRASPEVGTWKGFSQVHQELVGRTANGHLVSWVLGLNFTCCRAFPGQFFFISYCTMPAFLRRTPWLQVLQPVLRAEASAARMSCSRVGPSPLSARHRPLCWQPGGKGSARDNLFPLPAG